ncbi:unnamed protein product, partial [Timema podura]|nr:unnamed protein product [Timema podura]
ENPSKHPIIILKDVPYTHLQAILEFMYAGEVNVSQEQLPAFLKTADRLKVKGLAEAPQGSLPTFAWRESGKLLKKSYSQYTRSGLKPDLPIVGRIIYCVGDTLDYAATKD